LIALSFRAGGMQREGRRALVLFEVVFFYKFLIFFIPGFFRMVFFLIMYIIPDNVDMGMAD
jgi:hypothetical protein